MSLLFSIAVPSIMFLESSKRRGNFSSSFFSILVVLYTVGSVTCSFLQLGFIPTDLTFHDAGGGLLVFGGEK